MTGRRYVTELSITMAIYAALLVGSISLVKHFHPAEPAQTVLVLLPMLAVIAAAWVIIRQLRRMDELQQRIQMEGLAMAVCLTAVVTFGWGFLEGIGYPKFPTMAVWPLLAIGWLGGGAIAKARYR